MAASNILDIPFRKALPLSLTSAIKQYISSKYDQHPDMFKNDLAAIDKLRTDAITVLESHYSGLSKLGRYAAQLEWISGKFPIDIGAEFTWYPSIGYNTSSPITQNNLQFERANVLYNLAALYSKLATAAMRSTTTSLKSACNYFTFAAGTIKYIRDTVLPELRSHPPEDMDPMTLECLEKLMLAQAQECFWQRAVMEGMKDANIAKLAAKVADYYGVAGEFGVKSDAVSSEWIHHLSAKHLHFAAAAQFRAACDCLDKAKYGEEVARLTDALDCVKDALKESRYLNKIVLQDLKGLEAKIADSLKRAEKDNDLIYLAPVPPTSDLTPLQRADMVKAKIPPEIELAQTISETNPLGGPLFAKLVPFTVHLAASIYVEKRDRIVNSNIIEQLENLTSELHELLRSLNLPGSLQALEKPLGIPPGLMSHAEEIRQQDGVTQLIRSFEDIAKLKANNAAAYQEALVSLNSEAEEDEEYRRKHGTVRWSREPSRQAGAKYIQKAEEYANILKQAEASDELVRNKFAEFEPVLRLLAGSPSALHAAVPNSAKTQTTAKVEREVERLRQVLNDVSRLESRRRRKVEALREKAQLDDISNDILAEAARLERERPGQKIEPVHFEDFFENRLRRYDEDRKLVKVEAEVQAELAQRIKDANAAFVAARKVDNSTRDREQALQRLENGYFKYKEIMGNLETGRKFYNDLAKLLNRYRDEVRHFCYERRLEASQTEASMVNAMAQMHISNPTGNFHQAAPMSPPQPQRQAPERGTPLPGPTPTRTANLNPQPGVWQGDSNTPIRFGTPQ